MAPHPKCSPSPEKKNNHLIITGQLIYTITYYLLGCFGDVTYFQLFIQLASSESGKYFFFIHIFFIVFNREQINRKSIFVYLIIVLMISRSIPVSYILPVFPVGQDLTEIIKGSIFWDLSTNLSTWNSVQWLLCVSWSFWNNFLAEVQKLTPDISYLQRDIFPLKFKTF